MFISLLGTHSFLIFQNYSRHLMQHLQIKYFVNCCKPIITRFLVFFTRKNHWIPISFVIPVKSVFDPGHCLSTCYVSGCCFFSGDWRVVRSPLLFRFKEWEPFGKFSPDPNKHDHFMFEITLKCILAFNNLSKQIIINAQNNYYIHTLWVFVINEKQTTYRITIKL